MKESFKEVVTVLKPNSKPQGEHHMFEIKPRLPDSFPKMSFRNMKDIHVKLEDFESWTQEMLI